MSDLKQMVRMAFKKELSFLYCEEDENNKPLLLLAKTVGELKLKRSELKKNAKKPNFVSGEVSGRGGTLQFFPNKSSSAFAKDLKGALAQEAPDLKHAEVVTKPEEGAAGPDAPSQEEREDDTDALVAAVRKIKPGKNLRFFYCLEGTEGRPELLIDKQLPPKEIKRLKSGAAKKKFVRGLVTRNDKNTVVFRSKNYDVKPFQKDVRLVFGKRVKGLKNALFEPLGEGDETDEAIEEALEEYGKDEAPAETARPNTEARDAVAALRKARDTLNQALKDIYKGAKAPGEALAPLAAATSRLAEPSEKAAQELNKKSPSPDPDALARVNALTAEHGKLQAALNTLVQRYGKERAPWDKEQHWRDELEKFLGGAAKEGWDLATLTETMDSVRGPVNAARTLAQAGQYADAVKKLNEGWTLYQAGLKKHQAGLEAAGLLEDKSEVKAIRKQINALKKIGEDSFKSDVRNALRKKSSLTKEQREGCAQAAFDRVKARLDAAESRLTAMQESLTQAASRGAPLAELKSSYLPVIDEELKESLLEEVTDLKATVEDVTDGDDASALADLETRHGELLAELDQLFGKWTAGQGDLGRAGAQVQALVAKLDGLGADAATLKTARERAAAAGQEIARLRAEGDKFLANRKIWLQQLALKPSEGELDDYFENGPRKFHNADYPAWEGACKALLAQIEQGLKEYAATEQKLAADLNTARTEMKLWLDKIEALVTGYEGYSGKEIPETYVAKRKEKLAGFKRHAEIENIQALGSLSATLKGALDAGKKGDFPTVPEAIAMFRATMGRERGFFSMDDDNRREADKLLSQMKPFDFKGISDEIAALKSTHAKAMPALAAKLEADAAALQAKLQESGPQSDALAKEADALGKEVKAATKGAEQMAKALQRLADLQAAATERLNKHSEFHSYFSTTAFSGAFAKETAAVRAEAQAAQSAAALKIVTDKANKLADSTKAKWVAIANDKGETGLVNEMARDQKVSIAAAEKEKEDQTRRDDEWKSKLAEYKGLLKAAGDKGAAKDQISAMESLRDGADKDRKAAPTAEGHKAAMEKLAAGAKRLGDLAKNPDVDKKTAKRDLGALPEKWAAAVGKYKAGVAELRGALEKVTAGDEQADTLRVAIKRVDEAADLFDPRAFNASILAITFNDGSPDQIKQAREQGLRQVRAYRQQLNESPLVRAILTNPFARVAITDVHKCLGDIDLNLQRCL